MSSRLRRTLKPGRRYAMPSNDMRTGRLLAALEKLDTGEIRLMEV